MHPRVLVNSSRWGLEDPKTPWPYNIAIWGCPLAVAGSATLARRAGGSAQVGRARGGPRGAQLHEFTEWQGALQRLPYPTSTAPSGGFAFGSRWRLGLRVGDAAARGDSDDQHRSAC